MWRFRFLATGAVVLVMLSACGRSSLPEENRTPDSPTSRYSATPASLATHPLPQWWKDAKFGIFIHWGVYSVPAFAPRGASALVGPPPDCTGYAEWYWFVQQIPGCQAWTHHLQTYGADFVYDDFIPQWTADRFDPDAWLQLFQEAGAKYFVLTSKHHEGFALWPTATTRRNAVEMGPHRDLVGALFEAAHRAGDKVKPGLYYSIPEWYNPAPKPADAYAPTGTNNLVFGPPAGSLPPRNAYTQLPVPYTGYVAITDYAAGQVRPQLKELVDLYHPDVIWCDIGGREDYFLSNESIAYYYNQTAATNPEGVVVDDRCGDKAATHFDYNTVEYGNGSAVPPFEATRGMGASFGYNAQETDADYLSPAELIKTLVSTVASGGNLLLDIGPKADGTIPDSMTTRLQAMGAWLRINGTAIYGSRQWTQSNDGSGNYFTIGQEGALYIIATTWPGQTLTVNAAIPVTAATRITLLGSDNTPLAYRRSGSQLLITMPDGGDQRAATNSENAFVFRVAPA